MSVFDIIQNRLGTSLYNLFAVALFVTVLWEHIGRKLHVNFRPSVLLNLLARYSRQFFSWCGASWAWLNLYFFKFLNHIKRWVLELIGGMAQTITELISASWHLVSSPLYFLKGYLDYAVTFYQKATIWWMRAISFCIIGGITCLIRHVTGFSVYQKWCSYVTSDPIVNLLLLAAMYFIPIVLSQTEMYSWVQECCHHQDKTSDQDDDDNDSDSKRASKETDSQLTPRTPRVRTTSRYEY